MVGHTVKRNPRAYHQQYLYSAPQSSNTIARMPTRFFGELKEWNWRFLPPPPPDYPFRTRPMAAILPDSRVQESHRRRSLRSTI